ncbi:MAG: AEC family transporter [Clostridiales bacterium]|nr:AEC family transporter [Clostridia bacterium]MCR4884460.1 AEC family transporter [Clostridiales bacterium]
MEMISILVRQILQMFLLSGIGFVLYKTHKITQEGSKTLGNILIYLALPAVIINGFLVEYNTEHVLGIVYSAATAAVLLLLSILIARLFFRKDAIAAFAGAFSNPGFFGIPLIIASLGQGAVFYVACFVAFLNIGQWTYGVSILTGQPVMQGLQPKKLIRAPFILAILIGLLLFFTRIRLPQVISGCISSVAALNTPLAMFTVGIYLAQTDLLGMFRKKAVYLISLVRLLVIPLVSVLLLSLLPDSLYAMKMAVLLAIACPVGSNVAVYAQLYDQDYPYAVETVVISTLFSILTIPLVVQCTAYFW